MGQDLATQAGRSTTTAAASQARGAAGRHQHRSSASAGSASAAARPPQDGAVGPGSGGGGGKLLSMFRKRKLEDVCEIDKSAKMLGKGSFGTVLKAKMKDGRREIVAVKSMDKEGLRRMKVEPKVVHNEVAMMRECLGQDRFVQLYDFVETSSKYYLVLELCDGGNLQDGAQEGDGRMEEPQVQLLMRQMLEAIAYLHQKDICHRDVKPHNYMLRGKCRSESVRVKLGDFGIAVRTKPGNLLTQQMGTPAFMAPELHLLPRKSRGYDNKVDMWALGVCMVFLLANEYPFIDNAGRLLRDKIIAGDVPLWDTTGFASLFQRFGEATGLARRRPSRAGQDLTRKLLHPRREKRPTAAEALSHEWFCHSPLAEEIIATASPIRAPPTPAVVDDRPLLDWKEFEQGFSMLEKEIAWVVDAVGTVPVAFTAIDEEHGASQRLTDDKCVVCYQPGGDWGYICPQCNHIVCVHCLPKLPSSRCPYCRHQASDMAASQIAANIVNINTWQPSGFDLADVDVPVSMPVYAAPTEAERKRQGACHSCKEPAGITSYVCARCGSSLCYGCTKQLSSEKARCPACGDRQQFAAGLGQYLTAGSAVSSVLDVGAEMGRSISDGARRLSDGWEAVMKHQAASSSSQPLQRSTHRSATAPAMGVVAEGQSSASSPSSCCLCSAEGSMLDHVCPCCNHTVCVTCIREKLSSDLRCPHCHDARQNAQSMRMLLRASNSAHALWGGITNLFSSPTNGEPAADEARIEDSREDRLLFRGALDTEFSTVATSD